VAGECALKSTVSKMKGTRCSVSSLGKRKVVGHLFGSAPHAWRRARQVVVHGAATPTGQVAAARASEGRRRCRRWAKLGPKQKQAGRLDGPPRRGGPRWANAMAGRKMKKKLERTYGLQRSTGRIEMGREMKKYNRFHNFLIQGNGIKIKSFEYFQTKFELDSK
jgi:hypothetical protein